MLESVLVLAGCVLAAIVVHEGGHALAYRSAGIKVARAGLGLDLPPRLSRRIGSVTWTISPWLIGAYTRPDDETFLALDDQPYRTAAWHYNAGIVANLVFGLLVWGFAAANLGWLAGCAAAAAGVWWAGRWLAAYVIPFCAPGLLMWALASVVADTRASSDSAAGDSSGSILQVVPAVQDWQQVLVFVAAVSFTLASVNAVPLFPLDNGRVWGRILSRWMGPRATLVFQLTGLVLVLAWLWPGWR